MTPIEMGKYAALAQYGLYKDAGFIDWLKRVFGRSKGVAPAAEAATATKKVRAPRRKPAGPEPNAVAARDARPTSPDPSSEALRKEMEEKAQVAATPAAPGADKPGILSKIPWWGKALGLGAIGYGGYKMLAPSQEQQGMQPYFGPGTGYPQGY